MTSDSDLNGDLHVLARPGGNERVAEKKVLLAMLAGREAERLGIFPGPERVRAITEEFLRELGIAPESAAGWLEREGLALADLDAVMSELAAVLAVESHYRIGLAGPADRFRRLMAARDRLLAEKNQTL